MSVDPSINIDLVNRHTDNERQFSEGISKSWVPARLWEKENGFLVQDPEMKPKMLFYANPYFSQLNQNTMKNVQIKVKNEDHFNAVVKRMRELGYDWPDPDGNTRYELTRYIRLYNNNEIVKCSTPSNLKTITLDDLYDIEEPIMINGEVVEFKKDGIKVGCTTVSKETIKKIWDKVKESDYAMAE